VLSSTITSGLIKNAVHPILSNWLTGVIPLSFKEKERRQTAIVVSRYDVTLSHCE
jgi:hypothetical protein